MAKPWLIVCDEKLGWNAERLAAAVSACSSRLARCDQQERRPVTVTVTVTVTRFSGKLEASDVALIIVFSGLE
jgi:hypothetical protein